MKALLDLAFRGCHAIFMLEYEHDPGYYVDGWDGYVHSRSRSFEHLYNNTVPNPIRNPLTLTLRKAIDFDV